MTFHLLITELIKNTQFSLLAFLPELILCATIVLMLLARVFNLHRGSGASPFAGVSLALAGSAAAFVVAVMQAQSGDPAAEIFTGMLVYDSFTIFFRCLLLGFVALLCLLTMVTGIPNWDDSADFYTLVLGSTVGMAMMASANHLLIVFLAVEMASVPSFAMAGFLKGRRQSSEAALKYSVYGAGAAGVMLYGISLLAGILGTAHLPTMAKQLVVMDLPSMIAAGTGTAEIGVLALGGLMVMVGLAFKLSAVPFHFWCPDVFEGAPAEVNAFLSVASKAAAMALLVRVALGFSHTPHEAAAAGLERQSPTAAVAQLTAFQPPSEEKSSRRIRPGRTLPDGTPPEPIAHVPDGSGLSDQPVGTESPSQRPTTTEGGPQSRPPEKGEQPFDEQAAVGAIPVAEASPPDNHSSAAATASSPLRPVRGYIVQLIALIAAITATFGNLAAFGQGNIKRMLAYSTIAHAGYMMMPIAAAVSLVGSNTALAREALASLAFYLGLYLFMNLGAFAIVAFLRNAMRSERIDDYAGLIRSNPTIAVCFALILVSLIGLPPLAGFAAKYAIFLALVKAGGATMIALLVIAGLNTAISLVYYLRVVKVMTIDPEPDSRPPVELGFGPLTYTVAVTVPVVVFGVFFNAVYVIAARAADQLLR